MFEECLREGLRLVGREQCPQLSGEGDTGCFLLFLWRQSAFTAQACKELGAEARAAAVGVLMPLGQLHGLAYHQPQGDMSDARRVGQPQGLAYVVAILHEGLCGQPGIEGAHVPFALGAGVEHEAVHAHGACHVHERFSMEKLAQLKQEHPQAKVLAHPECRQYILNAADVVGSTQALLDFAVKSDAEEFIVAAESGIRHEMRKRCPHKTFIPAPPDDPACACNECNYMRLNTLQKLYDCLDRESPEITVDSDIRERAVKPILRMMEMSR